MFSQALYTRNARPVVLVIEDEPGDAQLIRLQLLERDPQAFSVHLADTLGQAQTLIDHSGLKPDVVLLDLNLPDSTGVTTVERCRALIVDAPVVVLTGLDDIAATRAAISAGAEDYLAKGADGAALRKAVRYAMLRHRRDADAHLAATVFSVAREGITITDPDGAIIDVNEAFTRITGYSREEVVGKNPRILSSGLQDREYYNAMWRELRDHDHWHGEIWNRRKNGEVYAEMLAISAVRDARGRVQHYVGLFSDISDIKAHQKQLEHIAHFDALTGLPNRVLLADRLLQAMVRTKRRQQRLVVVYLDLDGFKAINDTHGHEIGDKLLTTVANRMKEALRDEDTLGRLGGDEFVAVLNDFADSEACIPSLARLLAATSAPVRVGELVLEISASLGVTFYPQGEEIDADQLLRQADQAMYQAKLAGKSRYHFFDPELDRNMRGQHQSLERIRLALQQGEFVLHHQPKVNLRTGAVIGVEALIRWRHPELGLLSPAAFLPLIEEHELAVDLGEWVIDTALSQIETWRNQGIELPISVNIGARQLLRGSFDQRLLEILAAHPEIRPGDLELEVLETSALTDLSRARRVIDACRRLGSSIALDDFGTGYSSLTYLKHLPINQLKIDQSFVRDMLVDPDDLAIVAGILGLANAFHRQVIAEGVETWEHAEMLLRMGCDLAQGYGIARPMPAGDIPGWVEAWHNANRPLAKARFG